MGDAGTGGQVEQLQAKAEQHVMIRHAAHVLSTVLEDPESVSRSPDAAAASKGGDVRLSPSSGDAELSGDLRERPP